MAQLEWGKYLQFNDDEEYYETLGFLCQGKCVRVYIENNDRSGAGGPQGRMSIRWTTPEFLPPALKRAFEKCSDGRISETGYIRHIQKRHGFHNEDGDYVESILYNDIKDVLNTVPSHNKEDFYRGFNWNCELKKIIRENTQEINFDNITKQTETGEISEGRKVGYYTTKYERSSKARAKAIEIHGLQCVVCGFDFEDKYGEIGKGYIEVHHNKPLSTVDGETVVDPVTDLICVCANCHRMLHRFKDYIVSVDELKGMVESKE